MCRLTVLNVQHCMCRLAVVNVQHCLCRLTVVNVQRCHIVLETTNVISILISSDFLKMEHLVGDLSAVTAI